MDYFSSHLNEAVLTSIKIDYDEEFDRLWNLAIREKEEEIRTIHHQNGRILQLSNTENVVRYIKIRDKTKRYDKTFRIPTFPEHFFLASLHVDLPIFHFLSEYFDGKTPAQIKGTLYPLIDQAKRSFWNFSKKKKRNSHSKEEKAIITLKLEALFADHPGGLTFKQIKAGISEFANMSDWTIRNRLRENGYEVQGGGPWALWNHQTRQDKEKAIITRKLEDLFADHPEGLTFKQIKDAGITEFAPMSDGIIYNRLKENGYEAQRLGPGALWNHQQGYQTRQDKEKAIITRKLEDLFADHPEGLTFKQIKDAGISEFAPMSDKIIRNRLRENGYEAQGRGPGALWNHPTIIDEEKARLSHKLEDLFADHPGGLTFKQIKAGISEFANMSKGTIDNRLRENGYEPQGRGPGALWNHQIRIDKEKAIITRKLEALFADHPEGLTLKQIKAGITEFAPMSDDIIRNRLRENGYEAQGRGPGALWNHQQGYQTRQDKEKAIITRKLEALFADHPEGLTLKQIKAEIPEFANISYITINKRLKKNGYEVQGYGSEALWNHPTIIDEEKARLPHKLEALFADHPGGLTFKQIKDAGISEFAPMSDKIIRNRLRENGYEAQGRGPWALWNHPTIIDEEKARLSHKLEALFADHPGGLTFKQIKDAGISEFANMRDKTIRNRLRENGYEPQGRGPWALWNHQTRQDKEKAIITRKLEDLFADHPEGLTFKQIKAGISEFANMPDKTIHNRLKENGYEAQGRGPGALWKKKKINILFP